MLELIKSGAWDRWMKRDYFRNYSNFCILDFLLILTLKYINYIFNTKRHSDTFKHVANFFDIFTDPQLRDRHKTIDTTSFDRFRKLCASNRGGTREARRDFSPYFFFYINRIVQVDTNCSSTTSHFTLFHLLLAHDLVHREKIFLAWGQIGASRMAASSE